MIKIPLPVRGPRMAIVWNKNVFVTSYSDNKVIRMNWPVCDVIVNSVTIHRPRGIVMYKGLLAIACFGNPIGSIVLLNPATFEIVFRFETLRPRGIDVWKNLLVVTQVNTGCLVLFDKRGVEQQRFGGFEEPRDVCVCKNTAYVASTRSNCVICINLSTHTRHIVHRMHRPNGVATDGRTTVTTEWNSGRVVVRSPFGFCTFAAHTPCMVSVGEGYFLVCDHGANCMFKVPANRSVGPQTGGPQSVALGAHIRSTRHTHREKI